MPETKRHLELRTALYEILKLSYSRVAWIGSEQFVYWDPTDPSACIAPDVFLRHGGPDDRFDSWKVWERGAPHLAIEIVSGDDAGPAVTRRKIASYHRVGVTEVVRFDPDDASIRIWDRVEGDLVERVLDPERAPECHTLGLYWRVLRDSEGDRMLRPSRDAEGRALLPTREEEQRAAEEQCRVAQARVREVEKELEKRAR